MPGLSVISVILAAASATATLTVTATVAATVTLEVQTDTVSCGVVRTDATVCTAPAPARLRVVANCPWSLTVPRTVTLTGPEGATLTVELEATATAGQPGTTDVEVWPGRLTIPATAPRGIYTGKVVATLTDAG